MTRLSVLLFVAILEVLFVLVGSNHFFGPAALAKRAIAATEPGAPTPPPIVSISICSPDSHDGILQQGSCAPGTFDTHQIVLAPDGSGINKYVDGGISDEHQSVFPPGSLNGNTDYLFFVASRTPINTDTGMFVLSSVPHHEPDWKGQWTMDFAKSYGYYPNASPSPPPPPYAQVFLSPVGRGCPNVPDGMPAHQDQTFDLNYAAPGSIVFDPTNSAGNLLMIYEGTNTCFGAIGGPRSNNFYSSVGIATSLDYGHTWPTYRENSSFAFVPLPNQNTMQGPNAWPAATPNPALGNQVYEGNDTHTVPPPNYGRYAVLSPSVSIATAMATATPLPSSMGDAEMSAFVDDVNQSASPYLFVTYNDNLGGGVLVDAQEPGGLTIARAQLNGGTAPLSFEKWNQGSFTGNSGIGGYDSPIFPGDGFPHDCEAKNQARFGSSLSYVEATHQYLLTFVCTSPGDPASCAPGDADCFPGDKKTGAAWFYATSYDPSDPTQWSQPDALGNPQPREIEGSWSEFESAPAPSPTPTATPTPCPDYKGWYPTFMSPNKNPGHLSTNGYAFYLYGCQTADTPPPGRQYSSRAFKITTTDTTPPVTTAAVDGPLGLNAWYVGSTTVTFTATDDLSGVAKTEYSLDSGANWISANTLTLNTSGIYSILYRSTDLDDNVETPKSTTVSLDSRDPVISEAASPAILQANTGVVQVTISGKITDNLSGVSGDSPKFVVHDEYGKVQPAGPVTIDSNGNYSFTVSLRTFVRKSDSDGRLYTIRVSAADNAGNTHTSATTVTVKRLKSPPPCGKKCV